MPGPKELELNAVNWMAHFRQKTGDDPDIGAIFIFFDKRAARESAVASSSVTPEEGKDILRGIIKRINNGTDERLIIDPFGRS